MTLSSSRQSKKLERPDAFTAHDTIERHRTKSKDNTRLYGILGEHPLIDKETEMDRVTNLNKTAARLDNDT